MKTLICLIIFLAFVAVANAEQRTPDVGLCRNKNVFVSDSDKMLYFCGSASGDVNQPEATRAMLAQQGAILIAQSYATKVVTGSNVVTVERTNGERTEINIKTYGKAMLKRVVVMGTTFDAEENIAYALIAVKVPKEHTKAVEMLKSDESTPRLETLVPPEEED